MDAQRRKVWSRKHGHDTYGSNNSDLDEDEIKPKARRSVRLEGSANVGPPLINVPTIVNVLQILKTAIRENREVAVLLMTDRLQTVMSFITLKILSQMQKAWV